MSTIVFVGPTIPVGEVQSVIDADCWAPVAQGDIYRAVQSGPDVIGIIDGYFHGVPSVWHKEILWAMDQGIKVFGSASMGALRASELHQFGMQGVGRIFDDYRAGRLEDDDEVAVLHGPAELGYPSLSEPMVNIRATLARAVADGVVPEATAAAICKRAKERFYGDRTWEELLNGAESNVSDLRRWLPEGRVDLKREDALAMLQVMVQAVGGEPAREQEVGYNFEWTLMWDQALNRWTAENDGLDPIYEENTRDVLNELRLDEGRFHEIKRLALVQHLGLLEAQRQGLQVERDEHRAKLNDHRATAGLFRRADLDRWLETNGLEPEDYEALLADHARVDAVIAKAGPEMNRQVLAQLKLSGAYGELSSRARRKRDTLTKKGQDALEPGDVGLTAIELVSWHFGTRLGRSIPEDLDGYVMNLGLSSKADFYRILTREYLYWSGSQEGV